jgi:hypothetical protein
MKQTIRYSTFETNSSSYHSITLNRQYEAEQIVNELDDALRELDTKNDIYKALGLATQLVTLLTKELEEYRGD